MCVVKIVPRTFNNVSTKLRNFKKQLTKLVKRLWNQVNSLIVKKLPFLTNSNQ